MSEETVHIWQKIIPLQTNYLNISSCRKSDISNKASVFQEKCTFRMMPSSISTRCYKTILVTTKILQPDIVYAHNKGNEDLLWVEQTKYLVRHHMVLIFSQTVLCSFSRHTTASQEINLKAHTLNTNINDATRPNHESLSMLATINAQCTHCRLFINAQPW